MRRDFIIDDCLRRLWHLRPVVGRGNTLLSFALTSLLELSSAGVQCRKSISRQKWKEFFETFSERHEGWLVQVEIHDSQTDEIVASQITSLHSIDLDLEDEKNPRINVTVLYDNKELKHILFRPSQVSLHISEQDGEDSLRISSLNADTTIRIRGTRKVDALDVIKRLNILDVVRDEAA